MLIAHLYWDSNPYRIRSLAIFETSKKNQQHTAKIEWGKIRNTENRFDSLLLSVCFVWVARLICRTNHKNIIMATIFSRVWWFVMRLVFFLLCVAYVLSHNHTCRCLPIHLHRCQNENICELDSRAYKMYAQAINLILIASKYFVLLFISSQHKICEFAKCKRTRRRHIAG